MSSEVSLEEWAELLHNCNMAELEGGSGAYDVLDKLRAHHGLPPLYRGTIRPAETWNEDDQPTVIATCAKGHEHVMAANNFIPQVAGAVALLEDCPDDAPWVVHSCDWAGQPDIRILCDQSWTQPDLLVPRTPGGPYPGRNGKLYAFEDGQVTCTVCLAKLKTPAP